MEKTYPQFWDALQAELGIAVTVPSETDIYPAAMNGAVCAADVALYVYNKGIERQCYNKQTLGGWMAYAGA